jgi:hypothetical protein
MNHAKRPIALAISLLFQHDQYLSDSVPMCFYLDRLMAVFNPIEQVLSSIEQEGVVDSYRGKPIFHDEIEGDEEIEGGWYEVAEALSGIIDFHRIAATRHGWGIDLAPLERLHHKLDRDSPLMENELTAARGCIDVLKRRACTLTLGQAKGLLRDVKIGWELEQISAEAA